jgi:hypothetical protein
MFRTKVVEKIKAHTLCSINFFFFENLAVFEINVEKYGTVGQATEDNTAHALCMLET